jgi:multidrug efflux pump subunit AcrA (membrane-fusion protein)
MNNQVLLRTNVNQGKLPRPNSKFTRRRWATWTVGTILVAVIATLAYRHFHKSPQPQAAIVETATSTPKSAVPVTITVGKAATRSVRRTIDVVGTLYGFEEVVISSNVEGRVKRVIADVGDRVEAQDKLAEIDTTNFELAVRQAQRSLAVELAKLGLTQIPPDDFDIQTLPMVREAYSRMQFATRNAARTRDLSRSKAISEQELESANNDLQTSTANYENQLLIAKAALANLKLQNETLEIAKQQLVDSIITAPSPEHEIPFSKDDRVYAVSARDVSEGTFVRKGDEVFRLVIDSALRLRVEVPERNLATIALGQLAEVTTSAYPEPIEGKVSRINPVITASTRTFEVEILIDNSARRLKPGGFAKAKIITNENDTAISVPLESLVTFAGITKIFTVQNNHAKEIQVTVGEQGLDWIEIAAPPLDVGTVIVTSGQSALANDTFVKVRDEAQQ